MVRTNKHSRFALLSLGDIRNSKDVILQIEDTHTNFESGAKCYLCEVVNSAFFFNIRNEGDLIREICELNNDKRKLERKIARLEKSIAQLEKGAN